ncbi:unnamed protein product [Didymodactylos carnosus]|uniref:Uncharacterized protein n=2 Tax=Didymodactylos carnosus TaxID=1234261 RepID=A0A814B5V8_9BILA|nr:unnamed protein product [Didymodactylos carnosus]CAF3703644.1 unnamed protein product [Didymodactylos carnosus]
MIELGNRTLQPNLKNFQPKTLCEIEIHYVQEPELINSDHIQFIIPTTIAPRYNSDVDSDILIERIDFNNVQSIVSSLTATRHAAKSFVNDTHSILEGKSL